MYWFFPKNHKIEKMEKNEKNEKRLNKFFGLCLNIVVF
jgi:hypothetical protein